MTKVSRRDVLGGLAASSAASVVTAFGEHRQNAAMNNAALLSGDERRQHVDALHYFVANAPLLLRGPDGALKHPSVSPSLPGKRYSTLLWDWDPLWTCQGLFRLAAVQHDEPLKQKLCEHVSGSLLNFLDHASAEGRIPILMTTTDPDHRRGPQPQGLRGLEFVGTGNDLMGTSGWFEFARLWRKATSSQMQFTSRLGKDSYAQSKV
jgi:hypothetical protein